MSFSHTRITSKFLKDLLKDVQNGLEKDDKHQEVNIHEIWAKIIGEKLSGLTQVKSLNNGILVIKVNSSSLNQLLSTTEKPKILLKLKTQYPFLRIKNVVFKTS